MESLDDIFLNALQIADPAERGAYLAKACGGDVALRDRVETMLRDAESAEKFFGSKETIVVSEAASVSEGPGMVIGRYKLLEKIGEGGMGVVYMAEQREPVVRKVALKIIKLGMDTKQVVGRFEAERQALALMDHPNIAKVLDGGATETGRPYFVMELVQGLPMTQFCDEANLPMRERLNLFLDVCSAVQHAHQKGIIHRDLKPSNILVTLHGDKPVPMVIDFGVAKATQGRLTDKTVFTQFQQFIGTPAYMSPEQTSLSGLDVDTRSDIYSLGVLLYELLTGKTPFDAKELVKVGLDEMRRTIREQEPPRPSTRLSTMQGADLTTTAKHRRTEAPKLVHLVRGDLDWIVMKCLEKDRSRRYETASGLAMDLQRHLENEPVVARPPSTIYRIQKAIRRNKLTFAAATGIALALIAGMSLSLWQAARATRAERLAREQADAAKAVKDFVVTKLLFPANPATDPVFDPNKKAMLERIALALDGTLTNRSAPDDIIDLTNQPVIEAEIRSALGQGFGWLNDYDRAVAQHERVLALRQRYLGRDDPQTLHTAARVAYAYIQLNRYADAEKLLDATIATARSSSKGPSLGWGVTLMVKADLLEIQGRYTEALPCYQEAVKVMTQGAGESFSDIGSTLGRIARVTELLGRTNEAAQRWDEAIAHNLRIHGEQHPSTVGALRGQAMFLLRQGRTNEGVQILTRLIPLTVAIFGSSSLDSANAQYQLAQAFEQLGDFRKAGELYIDLPTRMVKFLSIGSTLEDVGHIGNFYAKQRRYEDARNAFEPMCVSLQSNRHTRLSQFLWLVTSTAATRGWPAAARVCQDRIDAFADQPTAWRIKSATSAFANDAEGFRKAAAGALSLASAVTNWDDQISIAQAVGRGPMEFSNEQSEQCAALIARIEALLPGATSNRLQQAYRTIGALQLRLGQPEPALANLESCLRNQPTGVNRASTLFLESLCLQRLGRMEDARAAFEKGESLATGLLPQPLGESENFLDEALRYCLMLSRESRTAIAGK